MRDFTDFVDEGSQHRGGITADKLSHHVVSSGWYDYVVDCGDRCQCSGYRVVISAAPKTDPEPRHCVEPKVQRIADGDHLQDTLRVQLAEAVRDRALGDVQFPADIAERRSSIVLELADDRDVDVIEFARMVLS